MASSLITKLSSLPANKDAVEGINNPFNHNLHPLAHQASKHLQQRLNGVNSAAQAGRMYGILVVQDDAGDIAYLAAFSGKERAGDEKLGFVPSLSADGSIGKVKFMNYRGEAKLLKPFYINQKPEISKIDSATLKLLQYAFLHKLKPLAMTEFWWGKSESGEVRHHAQHYPACRSQCWPVMPFMLEGLNMEPLKIPGLQENIPVIRKILYEDNDLLVVEKPAGVLSVPGKDIKQSVLTQLQNDYPDATGPLLLHRLDMLTSGILLVAKNEEAHKNLQRQFMLRNIEKRYVALLAGVVKGKDGVIELPLRVDVNDRPRQLVCFEHGKHASTRWTLLDTCEGKSRVYFYPQTGRTHQLRIHAAHCDGLAAPIVGDPLYGQMDERLYLHAEQLVFTHPISLKRIEVNSPPLF